MDERDVRVLLEGCLPDDEPPMSLTSGTLIDRGVRSRRRRTRLTGGVAGVASIAAAAVLVVPAALNGDAAPDRGGRPAASPTTPTFPLGRDTSPLLTGPRLDLAVRRLLPGGDALIATEPFHAGNPREAPPGSDSDAFWAATYTSREHGAVFTVNLTRPGTYVELGQLGPGCSMGLVASDREFSYSNCTTNQYRGGSVQVYGAHRSVPETQRPTDFTIAVYWRSDGTGVLLSQAVWSGQFPLTRERMFQIVTDTSLVL